jgi:uracil-DNA glycosylase family 4
VKELEAFANIVSAAKGYFETRLAMGESSIVLDTRKGCSEMVDRLPEEALARLEKRARKCKRCPLHKTRTNVVFGTGSGKTRLVFIGEAPGRDEDLQGKPFVGKAGQLLTRIIEAIHFDRGDVYITNVIKCRPEGNRDPLPEEIELCSTYLTEQLEILKPKAICALGRFAAQALSGLKLPMASYRKESLFYEGTRVIATYHPAACLRNPSLKRLVWEDVQKLMQALKNV